MTPEGTGQDYKSAFDSEDPSAKLKLVKDLVAMANSGGGIISVGRGETETPGIDPALKDDLDSARMADYADKFIAPASLDLSHGIENLDNGNVVVNLQVEESDYPLVMSRQGTWSGFDSRKDKPLFYKGEIWVRHSSKTEKVFFEDIRRWIDTAVQSERVKITERLTTYVNLPEGTSLQVVSPSGMRIDSPQALIESAIERRKLDPSHLLDGEDLLWIFRQRDALRLEDEHLRILLASSLRRSPTLFWWLTQSDDESDLALSELEAVFEASDRDRSDAAPSIIELAALYASEDRLANVLDELERSDYKHFQEAASGWEGRETRLDDLSNRIRSAKHNGSQIIDLSASELEQLADVVAEELVEGQSSGLSRKLGSITRVIWSRFSGRGRELMDEGT